MTEMRTTPEYSGSLAPRCIYGSRSSMVAKASVAIAVVLVVGLFARVWHLSHAIASQETYSRVETTIASGECARTTGKLLAACLSGRILPYRDVSSADDPGIPILLGMLAVSTNVPINQTTLVRINLVLTLAGVVGLALWLHRRVGARGASCWLFLAGLTVFVKNNYLSPDVFGTQFALAALGLLAVLATLPPAMNPPERRASPRSQGGRARRIGCSGDPRRAALGRIAQHRCLRRRLEAARARRWIAPTAAGAAAHIP